MVWITQFSRLANFFQQIFCGKYIFWKRLHFTSIESLQIAVSIFRSYLSIHLLETLGFNKLDEFQEKVWIIDFCQLLEIWNNLTWLHFNVLLCLSKQIQAGVHGPQIRLFSRVSMYLYLMNARLAEVGLDNSPKTKKDALQRRSTDPLMCIVQCSCSNSWLLPAWLTSATQLSKFGRILQLRGGQYPCFMYCGPNGHLMLDQLIETAAYTRVISIDKAYVLIWQ